MSMIVLALIVWFLIGFIIAWLVGRATDIGGLAESAAQRGLNEETLPPSRPVRHRMLSSRGMRQA